MAENEKGKMLRKESIMDSITEDHGVYKNHNFVVKLFADGHRCGYVRLEESDHLGNIDFIVCHGGITYEDYNSPGGDYLPAGSWIGFDCLHLNDAFDTEAAEKAFGKNARRYRWAEPTIQKDTLEYSIKTVDFCKKQCQTIIEQLLVPQEA